VCDVKSSPTQPIFQKEIKSALMNRRKGCKWRLSNVAAEDVERAPKELVAVLNQYREIHDTPLIAAQFSIVETATSGLAAVGYMVSANLSRISFSVTFFLVCRAASLVEERLRKHPVAFVSPVACRAKTKDHGAHQSPADAGIRGYLLSAETHTHMCDLAEVLRAKKASARGERELSRLCIFGPNDLLICQTRQARYPRTHSTA